VTTSPDPALPPHTERPARAGPRLAAECFLVFGGSAALLYAVRSSVAGLFFPLLWAAGIACAVALRRDPGFDWRAPWRLGPEVRGGARRICLRFAAVAPLLTLAVVLLAPERAFDLPRERTGLWLAIVVLYPLLSVVPQELVFRAFFHHRYAPLFPRTHVRTVASAVAFGLAHVFFENWEAPLLSAIGGWMFAETYERTGSLWLACLDHALWGDLIMTIGLGSSFYAGNIGSG